LSGQQDPLLCPFQRAQKVFREPMKGGVFVQREKGKVPCKSWEGTSYTEVQPIREKFGRGVCNKQLDKKINLQ